VDGLQPRPGRYDVEITSPWRYVCLRSHSRLHWSSTGPLRRLREVDVAPQMPDKAGSSPALRNEADPKHNHGEAFSPLAPSRSHAHRCQTPPSSLLPRTAAPSLSGASVERAFSHSARRSSSVWRSAQSSRGSASPTTCCLMRRRCDISFLLFILRHFYNWPLDSAVGQSVAPGTHRDSSTGLLFG
jgi:hypothetical protein